MSFTGFWLIIGIGLLFSALVAALKIGLWVWIATRLLGRPVQQYQDEPVARRGSAANGIKTWLTIIATVLGILSTTVGLLEKCNEPEPVVPAYTPRRTPTTTYGYRCCTSIGNCPMMTGGMPMGSVCTCMGLGGFAQGRVCQ
jgi:hypothetical protein